MKKILITILLSIIITGAFAQFNFRTEYMSFRYILEPDTEFCEWSDWDKTRMECVVTAEYVSIMSVNPQFYTIQGEIEEYDFEGATVLRLNCLDSNQKRCILDIAKYDKNTYLLYVRWSDLELVYKMEKL
jgi:hypothetical protein